MTRLKSSAALSLLTFAALYAPYALADDAGWYFGGGVGQSRAKIDDARITRGLFGAGLATTSLVDDDRDLAYKIYGGYRFGRYVALEGGYFDLGKFGFKANTSPTGTLAGDIKLRGANLDLVGILPIASGFSAFGRVGVTYAHASDSFRGSGAVHVTNPNPSRGGLNYKFGAGVQYDFNPSLGMRVEVERYRVNDAVGNKGDVDLALVGLVYKFGGRTPSAAPMAEAAPPAPVPVAAPAPEPVVVPPPPVKLVLSADALFDFGKARLKPAGKAALDKFAGDLDGTRFDVITVTGYADRIGSHSDNLKLSTRRAEAVKAYLVDFAHLPATKIVAEGADGAKPVTTRHGCKGNTVTPRLIACLQPDRRVEVEVAGTK